MIAAASSRVVLVAGVPGAALKFTDWGVAMRAAAERPATATLMGIRLSRVAAGAWVLAGALAAVAGLFFTAFPSPGLSGTVGQVALGAPSRRRPRRPRLDHRRARRRTDRRAVATFAAGYQDQLAFLGRGFGDVAPYVVMLLVLLVRPSGLFGSREVTRV